MYKRILVPVDGSSNSNRALKEAIRLAHGRKTRLRIVHVVDAINFTGDTIIDAVELLRESGRKILHKAEARARKAGVASEVRLLGDQKFSDRISDVIVKDAAAWHADVVVMGTHGRRGLNRLLLGSVANAVVRTSQVPVLLIRGK